MENGIEKIVEDILQNLPNESTWIDYKLEMYSNDKKADFIKDVIALLNTEENIGKDKFIIIGVSDKEKYLHGIKEKLYQDSDYQELIKKISPRPNIKISSLTFNEKIFGYIYIPKENCENIYEVNIDYGNVYSGVHKGQAFTRFGSTNDILDQSKRELVLQKMRSINFKPQSYDTRYSISFDKDILMISLIGEWNEQYDGDKSILSDILNKTYCSWIEEYKDFIDKYNYNIQYKNATWSIENRVKFVLQYSGSLYDRDLKILQEKFIKYLTYLNPKYELDPDERYAAAMYGKVSKYSQNILNGMTESIAIISKNRSNFIHCTESNIEQFVNKIVFDVLSSYDWRIWANLGSSITNLAEAAPRLYLKILSNSNVKLKELLYQEERSIGAYEYSYCVTDPLCVLAWYSEYFQQSVLLLSETVELVRNKSQYEKILNKAAEIILPWLPKTFASDQMKIASIRSIYKENDKFGWDLLLELMPGKHSTSSSYLKPKWDDSLKFDISTTVAEYQSFTKQIIDLSLEIAKDNPILLKDIIPSLAHVSEEIFRNMLSAMSSDAIIKMDDENKYILWDKLSDLWLHHKDFSEQDWALPEVNLNEIYSVIEMIKPKDILIFGKRFFKSEQYYLRNYKSDQDENALLHQQIDIVKQILSKDHDMSSILQFIFAVDEPRIVGVALAKSKCTYDANKFLLMLSNKNEKIISFNRGLFGTMYLENKLESIRALNINSLNLEARGLFFSFLAFDSDVWELVEEYLGSEDSYYWSVAWCRYHQMTIFNEYPLNKLYQNNRLGSALDLCASDLNEKQKISMKEFTIKLLIEYRNDSVELTYYEIGQLIAELQNDINDYLDSLTIIEWKYLRMLDDYHIKPIALQMKIEQDPAFLVQLLRYIKGDVDSETDSEKKKQLTEQAFYFINYAWQKIPGFDENNDFHEEIFERWKSDCIALAEEQDLLKLFYYAIGKVLFHTPPDKNGCWINLTVAAFLNKKDSNDIRDSYKIQTENARGIHSIDPTGQQEFDLAQRFTEKAIELEKHSLVRFAATMREIADSYESEGRDNRDSE